MTLHNQHIRVPELRKIPVSGHIADCSDREPKYHIFPFFQMKTDSIIKRKEKEKFFIRKFLPTLKARSTQLTSPEIFFIFCIRVHFEFPHMKMRRKIYQPVLVFEISAFKIIKF